VSEAVEMAALFQKGLSEYEKGDYFEAHEAWEDTSEFDWDLVPNLKE
jgi:hypothetical protein|tara:strand:+ start:10690 stop:10830 length:141 start_codon:yes stop_codon:yes gene_type:complete